MSTARIPDGTPLGLVQVGLAVNGIKPTWANVDMSTIPQAGRSDPPVKPTSEVAHQPGQQPAASDICRATDCADSPDGPRGVCNLPAGHDGDWHQEWSYRGLWAEWRGPHPGERCSICGRDGSEH